MRHQRIFSQFVNFRNEAYLCSACGANRLHGQNRQLTIGIRRLILRSRWSPNLGLHLRPGHNR